VSPEEALERIRLVPQLLAWLEETPGVLELPALEAAWLAQARALVAEAGAGIEAALEQARALPELTTLRAEWVVAQQQSWVEALEHFQSEIARQLGTRSPLGETLFAKVKLASLRRARPEAMRDFAADFERRRQSSYVLRQLEVEAHAGLRAPLDEVEARARDWERAQTSPPLEGESAERARAQLIAVGERVDLRLSQARLLTEAALLGTPGGVDRIRSLPRPRRRASRSG
jgi:hypothetical protein